MFGSRSRNRSGLLRAGDNARRKHKPDYLIVMISIVLLGFGLVVVYSISPGLSAHRDVPENYYVSRQLIAIAIGLIGFIVAAKTPIKSWEKLLKPMIVIGGVATLTALLMPVTPEYPAHRWIRVGGLSLQSVEIIKMTLIFWLAFFLSKQSRMGKLNDDTTTIRPLVIVGAILMFVVAVLQKDLGSAGVLFAIAGLMVYVAGVRLGKLLPITMVVIAATGLLILSSSYRRDRVVTFLNPERDCQNTGYQACQALIAVGSGGVSGKGIAHSVQAYGYLPEAANDSIFAIYAEKSGFLGTAALVALFIGLFTRIKNIAEKSPDMISRLIAVGILAWLSTQAFINIGAMIGMIPLKGITLPFISYGGTSIIFVLTALGVAFNLSRFTNFTANDSIDEQQQSFSGQERRGVPYGTIQYSKQQR